MGQPVRLVGIGAGGLQPDTQPVQQPLFADDQDRTPQRWEKVDQTLDAISRRYGRDVIVRGTLKDSERQGEGE
ncbi:MAG: hypothetical protein KFF50_01515, partial [Desulfatitalea sp.]|nr:hypothetical protein [Desulfatitalea sp.]